jgi:hypothetical protein
VIRVLLVDPSKRGGIAACTALLARALRESGVCVEILGSRELSSESDLEVVRLLPADVWGKPAGAGLGFYLGRLHARLLSSALIIRHVKRTRPDIVHFQAPINRRLDSLLLRWLRSVTHVVWTAHDTSRWRGTSVTRDASLQSTGKPRSWCSRIPSRLVG